MNPNASGSTRPPAGRRAAVVGGGWAGLAAAVSLVDDGFEVTLLEMSARLGGRAREVEVAGACLDNGQHILIGAYTETLRLMRRVHADPAVLLERRPLAFVDAQGLGLRLPRGPALAAFARGVLAHPRWTWRARIALLVRALRWASGGFTCDAGATVADLARGLPPSLQRELVEPLCVAALNTPADEASGTVFLRVLRDALFSGAGSSDLLLPKASLGALFPAPALRWLEGAGARVTHGHRVGRLTRTDATWDVDGARFDQVVLATPPRESARLVRPIAPDWAQAAETLRYEPIVTVYLSLPGVCLPAPMIALPDGPAAAAQFVFDQGALRNAPEARGLMAFVISGAARWLERGQAATEAAVLQQAAALVGGPLPPGHRVLRTIAEKRATFRCTPESVHARAPMRIADGLWAAGDHVAGPYPATLEGAVRSGVAAARAAGASARA